MVVEMERIFGGFGVCVINGRSMRPDVLVEDE